MSDTQAPADQQSQTPTPENEKPGEGASTPPEPPAQDELEKWKADARKWEERAKQNKEAADRLAEYEEAQKTEAQKQAEALEKTQNELQQYKQREQVQQWAKDITKDSHIPADALRGSTEEELKAHHEQLAALVPVADQKTRHVIAGEGESTPLALNGDGIESALKNALGIK